MRRRNGQSIQLDYDALDRLVARSYPDSTPDVTFTYDLLGRRTAAAFADAGEIITWDYDVAGRVVATSSGGRTLGYQYDEADNRTRITCPDGFFVTTDYDALNQVEAIREEGADLLAAFDYDALSRRVRIDRGNATSTSYGYDAQSRLQTLSHDLAGSSADVTFTYTRNQAGQITGLDTDQPGYVWLPEASPEDDYTVNGLNQYTEVSWRIFTHDGNGNLTSDGVRTYGYDLDNRLTSVTAPGSSAALAYDPIGRLSRTEIDGSATELLYDGVDLVGEYDQDGNLVRRYVHGPAIDEPIAAYQGSESSKDWLYADHLGSVIAIADGAGTAGAISSYSPFGMPKADPRTRLVSYA